MKLSIRFTSSIALVSALALTGCRFTPGNTKVQYMPDMADSPTVKAQENYLEPPEHSVPINGVLYPNTPEEAEKELKNPYPVSEQIIEEGKVVYNKTCITCHGVKGDGHNFLGDKFPKAANLTDPKYKDKSDAYFFYVITKGFANMPSLAHATSSNERWKIAQYVRTLQNK